VPSALFFGVLEAGGGAMQREAGVPAVATDVVKGVVILVSIGFASIAWPNASNSSNASTASPDAPDPPDPPDEGGAVPEGAT